MSRVPALLGIAIALSMSLAACGSDSSSTARTSGDVFRPTFASDSPGPIVSEEGPPPESDSAPASLHEAGTFTETGSGTQLSQTWSVGQPEQGSSSGEAPSDVPDDVLEACNVDYDSVIPTIVFVPATVEVKYTQGSLAQIIGFANSELVTPDSSQVAFEDDGEWTCGAGGAGSTFTIQAGTDVTINTWILVRILDNSHPSVTEGDEDNFRVNAEGIVPPPGLDTRVTGPGALCAPDQDGTPLVLFLYRASGGKVPCD